MPKTFLEELKRKKVVVRAGGLTYRGILLEVTEQDITLRGETSFVCIPMDRITSVRDPAAQKHQLNSQLVDESFYSADLSEKEES